MTIWNDAVAIDSLIYSVKKPEDPDAKCLKLRVSAILVGLPSLLLRKILNLSLTQMKAHVCIPSLAFFVIFVKN